MREKKWCIAWDGSPFTVTVESLHRTRRQAEAHYRYIHARPDRCFVTTVAEVDRLDAQLAKLLASSHDHVLSLPQTRFEIAR